MHSFRCVACGEVRCPAGVTPIDETFEVGQRFAEKFRESGRLFGHLDGYGFMRLTTRPTSRVFVGSVELYEL